jgi:hypothetical protein
MILSYNKIPPKRKIVVHNSHHLGDQIINFILFKQIKEYIETNNIFIYYHCRYEYIKNVLDFNCSKNIIINQMDNVAYIFGYELWMATVPDRDFVENRYCEMFNNFLNKCNIPITVDTFLYDDREDLIERFKSLGGKYENIHILIVNSSPRSGQFAYDKNEFNNFIIDLSKKYSVATTEWVNDEILSLDQISVRNIASIAANVKKVIAINTGPFIPLYNRYVLDNIDVLYVLDHFHSCGFKTPKLEKKKSITELFHLLDA